MESQDHLLQYHHNRKLARSLQNTEYSDWRATALFYAMLHLVQAYLSYWNTALVIDTHAGRVTAIERDPRISAVYDDYRSLLDWSTATRYQGKKPEQKDFDSDILPTVKRIEEHFCGIGILRTTATF